MIIGAQTYTVRTFAQTEEGFVDTIKKIADIGYSCVQISGVGDFSAKTIRKVCDDHGLPIVLTHTKSDKVLLDTDSVIEDHKIMGAHYIGIGSMPEAYRHSGDGAKAFVQDFLPVAQKIKAAGLQFMYHNHEFEFEKYNGKLVLDTIIEGFEPTLLGFILDTFWVQAGGSDPALWIKKLKGRVDTIHFKDWQVNQRQRQMAAVMEGNLHWDAIFEACEYAGVKWAFIEQDDCNGLDPFDCLKTSLCNLQKRGYK